MAKLRLIVAITLVLGLFSEASAAVIEMLDIPGAVDFVIIKGEITDGDSQRFFETIQNRQKVAVYLQSPGGLIREALKIGAEIRYRNYATVVAGGDECYSACGLIWVSGVRRYLSADSLIGFHAAYREEAGEFRESGVANAEIGSFLTHLGLRIEAIRFFTIAGPNNFSYLTPERARALGIEIFLMEDNNLITPYDAPTGDRYAERWILYNILRSQCQGYFRPEMGIIRRELENAFTKGNEILGGEQWVKLWTQLLDQWGAQIKSNGHVLVCVEAEQLLRKQGLPTGIDGPSFDCKRAGTSTEKAMCADQELWSKDRAISAIYFWIRDNAERNLRESILSVQRAWLAARNDCRADRQCLNNVYDQRLQELKLIVIQ